MTFLVKKNLYDSLNTVDARCMILSNDTKFSIEADSDGVQK